MLVVKNLIKFGRSICIATAVFLQTLLYGQAVIISVFVILTAASRRPMTGEMLLFGLVLSEICVIGFALVNAGTLFKETFLKDESRSVVFGQEIDAKERSDPSSEFFDGKTKIVNYCRDSVAEREESSYQRHLC